MADNTFPTDEDVARTNAAADATDRLASSNTNLSGALAGIASSATKGSSTVADLAKALHLAGEKAEKTKESFSQITSLLPEFANLSVALDRLSSLSAKFGDAGESVARTLIVFTNVLPRDAKLFGELGDVGAKAGLSISENFGKIVPVLDQILPRSLSFLSAGFQKIAEGANDIQNLEIAFYNATAASGQLPANLDEASAVIDSLNDRVTVNNAVLNDMAAANYTTIDAAMRFQQAIMVIPGALGATVNAGKDWGDNLRVQYVGMKVATSVGKDYAEMANIMNQAYLKFGAQTDASTQLVARMGSVMRELKMPFDTISAAILSTATSFKMFGDNSEAALSVMEAFGPALKKGGLGPEAITELVGHMTDAIGNMDVAHRAFISGASGGPGGLFGAFQIQYLMQKGKMDEVLRMTVQGMQRQFGGPVITLEQVMKQPSLAGEFQKQISYLKDVAGIARTDQEASRILDALQSGSAEKLKAISERREETPAEALDKALTIGNSFQQKIAANTGELINLTRHMQQQQLENSRRAFEATAKIAGTGRTRMIHEEENARRRMRMGVGLTEGGGVGGVGLGEVVPKTEVIAAGKENAKSIQEMKNAAIGIVHRFKETAPGREIFSRVGAGLAPGEERREFSEFMESPGMAEAGMPGAEMPVKATPAGAMAPSRAVAAGRTATLPTPARALAAPAEAMAAGQRAITAHERAGLAAPNEVIRVEVVLKDEHMREIATGQTEAVLKRVHASAYSNKPF